MYIIVVLKTARFFIRYSYFNTTFSNRRFWAKYKDGMHYANKLKIIIVDIIIC